MDLQEKLKQLKLERDQLSIAYHEITGAMKILEQQIAEQNSSEASQPSDTEASNQPEEVAS